jgi:hypothetical protein
MDDLAWLEPSRLELLADDAGITPGELREWLYEEIGRRRSEAAARGPVVGRSLPETGGSEPIQADELTRF